MITVTREPAHRKRQADQLSEMHAHTRADMHLEKVS